MFNDEECIKPWLTRVAIALCKDFKKSFRYKRTEAIAEQRQAFSDIYISIMQIHIVLI